LIPFFAPLIENEIDPHAIVLRVFLIGACRHAGIGGPLEVE
jgi:hypothetical protein